MNATPVQHGLERDADYADAADKPVNCRCAGHVGGPATWRSQAGGEGSVAESARPFLSPACGFRRGRLVTRACGAAGPGRIRVIRAIRVSL